MFIMKMITIKKDERYVKYAKVNYNIFLLGTIIILAFLFYRIYTYDLINIIFNTLFIAISLSSAFSIKKVLRLKTKVIQKIQKDLIKNQISRCKVSILVMAAVDVIGIFGGLWEMIVFTSFLIIIFYRNLKYSQMIYNKA